MTPRSLEVTIPTFEFGSLVKSSAEFARMVYFHFGMSRCLLDKLVAILYEFKRVHRVPPFPGILPPVLSDFGAYFFLQKVSSQLVLLPIGSQRWSWTTCLMALGVLESKSGINVSTIVYTSLFSLGGSDFSSNLSDIFEYHQK